MNEKKIKMDYIGVLSSKPGSQAYRSTFKYFKKYLITLGEPTASPNWSLPQILRHAKHIIEHQKQPNSELMIDSGGFQFIVKKISRQRALEYIECYHIVLDMYHDKIQKIFSLDVNNFEMTATEILEWNYKSTQMTIDLINKYPELKNKVLFVLQNRNERVFEIWRKLFLEKRVWEHFDLYSIGGLVNLKKETKVDFNHAVPGTLWLLTYAKHLNFEVKQLHWLGQSSKVVFIAMALIEKLYGIYLTSDSSELIRFAPISAKLPLMKKVVNCIETDTDENIFVDDFEYATNGVDVLEMLNVHSWDDDKCLRANRENLKELDIDRDILNVVPQDILDYMIFVHIFGAKKYNEDEILDIMKQNKSKIVEISKSLYRICNSQKLHKEDLLLINFKHDEEFLNTWNSNLNLNRESFLVLGEVYAIFYDNIERIKNFKYQNQRSTIAKEIFIENEMLRLDNGDQIELICQHVEAAIMFADQISDPILELGLENVTIENLKKMHPIMDQGKTAKTTYSNIQWMLKFKDIIETGNIEAADEIMRNIVRSYNN